jgi:hypothetical protein
LSRLPHEATPRILLEQLGLNDQKLDDPKVFSEVYGSPNHWGLEILSLREKDSTSTHPAWKELEFVDLTNTKKEEITRFHEDILAYVSNWKA